MTSSGTQSNWTQIEECLNQVSTLSECLQSCVELVRQRTLAESIQIRLEPNGSSFSASYPAGIDSKEFSPLSIKNGQLRCAEDRLITPLYIEDAARSRVEPQLAKWLKQEGVSSYALLPVYCKNRCAGWLELRFYSSYYRWRQDVRRYLELMLEVLEQRIDTISILPDRKVTRENEGPQQGSARTSFPSDQLVEYSNVLVIRTDPDFVITEFVGDSQRIFGLPVQHLVGNPDVWSEVLSTKDYRALASKMRRLVEVPAEFSEELEIANQHRGTLSYFMLKVSPILNAGEQLEGWECLGIDITHKRETEQKLLSQNRRIEALFEISRSLQVNLDPALVTLKGLKTLVQATGSDAGLGCFYDWRNDHIEIVAAEGLSEQYIGNVTKIINGQSLVRYVVENKVGLLLKDVQDDDRAAVTIAREEGLRSTVVMPMMFEREVLGAVVLFCHRADRFTQNDFELTEAAANQIALVARQAEFFAAEKQQASSLATLYRLSHELSTLLSPREIAETAFPIIQEELACKRMWLGVINDQNTHLVGQGGIGPGVRRHIIDLQVELELQHDFLDEALRSRKAVIVEPNQEMECSGLNRLVKRLGLGTLAIVPLVSLGQVVGVFIVEPSIPSKVFVERKLPLLTSMAGEIATVILARRFEAKMAYSEKMRMAGLLASGVAHNFNNLLQAVMGQASLIEMQLPEDSLLRESARTIIEAAGRGASLIKQMLSFSMPTSYSRKVISVNKILSESNDLYDSLIGSGNQLDIELDPEAPEVYADLGQLQQVITNLVVNAREAIPAESTGKISISTAGVRVRSGEVDPELAPGFYLRLDVRDNGTGMDEEQVARCFEPFYTSKNVDTGTGLGFEGSGLGLSSAYSVVKQHEGIIGVRSTRGEGTVFSVYLPARTMPMLESTKGILQEVAVEGQVEALIAGLGESEAQTVTSTLQSLGVPVTSLSSAELILDELKESPSLSHFVVIDAESCSDNLIQLVRKIRALRSQTRILISTAEQARWVRLLASFDRVQVVEKPIGVWAIHSTMRELALTDVRSTALSRQIQIEKSADRSDSAALQEELEGVPSFIKE